MSYFALRNIDPSAYESTPLPHWLVSELSGVRPDAEILDFGCGFGQTIREIKNLGFSRVAGADVDPAAMAYCRENGHEVYDISGGFGNWPPDSKFDVIITMHVIEHIAKSEVIEVLSGLRALLKADGKLLIAVPNAQAFTGAYWAYEDFTHHTLYTFGSLFYVLKAAGFSDCMLLDKHALLGSGGIRGLARACFSYIYATQYNFWKKVLGSPTHISSTDVFTYEIKMRALP